MSGVGGAATGWRSLQLKSSWTAVSLLAWTCLQYHLLLAPLEPSCPSPPHSKHISVDPPAVPSWLDSCTSTSLHRLILSLCLLTTVQPITWQHPTSQEGLVLPFPHLTSGWTPAVLASHSTSSRPLVTLVTHLCLPQEFLEAGSVSCLGRVRSSHNHSVNIYWMNKLISAPSLFLLQDIGNSAPQTGISELPSHQMTPLPDNFRSLLLLMLPMEMWWPPVLLLLLKRKRARLQDLWRMVTAASL